MKVVIEIPDAEEQFFANLMADLGYTSEKATEAIEIPEWHKDVLDARASSPHPQKTISLDELEQKWAGEA
jgi:hypothetical protein